MRGAAQASRWKATSITIPMRRLRGLSALLLEARGWPDVACVSADALKPETLAAALRGVDVAYYLVHSMAAGRGFSALDREAARNFAQNELKPGVIERDAKMEYPYEQVKKMGELGFLGMMVPPQYGGGGMDTVSYVLAMEEISKIDASCSVVMSVNNSLVCWPLETYGNEDQKQRFLKPLAAGQKLGAYCLSEPGAGTDAAAQRTVAKKDGDHWVLNGMKNFITNGANADILIVFAQTDAAQKHKGISCLLYTSPSPRD